MKLAGLPLAAVVAVLSACSASSAEDAGDATAAVSGAECPDPFVGGETPDAALPLGKLTDADGYQDQTRVGSLAIGQTVYFRLDVTDATNLRNPTLAFAVHSVYRTKKGEDIYDSADDTIEADVGFTCGAGEPTLTCFHPSNVPARADRCPAMWGDVEMKIDCPGADESGVAVLRVKRKSIAFAHATDDAAAVPRACGLTYVDGRNKAASVLGR
jgi:hypothetical protein